MVSCVCVVLLSLIVCDTAVRVAELVSLHNTHTQLLLSGCIRSLQLPSFEQIRP